MHIYRRFAAIALKMKREGADRCGASFILELVRWRTRLRQRGDRTFKVNNNWRSGLARMAMAKHEELEGFF